jgi:hypothetical protein
MSVKAKFVCNSVKKHKWSKQDEGHAEITLSAVTSDSEENKEFWNLTPVGNINMQIKNEAAEKHFEPGEEYYLTFEKA